MNKPPSIGYVTLGISSSTQKAFNCNRLTFINKGTQIVTIDRVLVLSPGQSITYPAWPGEVNTTTYNIFFPSQVQGCLLIAICKNENWK